MKIRAMKIEKINVYEIALPFAGHFPHALNKGAVAKNIVCEIVAEDGKIRGYGEGAPRPYVTGETPETALSDITRFARLAEFPKTLTAISQVWDFIDGLPEEKTHHAAICALESALLDAFGKKEGRYLSAYFPKNFFTETIRYGAVIPLWNQKGAEEICRRITEKNISRVKLKMGKDLDQNRNNLETVRALLGDDCDLKVDANGSWDKSLAFQHIPLLEPFNVRVIEQPMAPGDPAFEDYAGNVTPRGIFLMADESVCTVKDLDPAIAQGFTMVNVRLSKCGGFRKSLGMIDRLRERKIRYQIGCHLGESGILSAAGRILSLICKDAVYHDGSYDEYLLKENVTTRPVSFGSGGEAGALSGFGLGVEVDFQFMERLCRSFSSVQFP